MVVDELAAVVGVDPEDGKRELGQHGLQRGEHPLLGLVADRLVEGPAGGDVGHSQGEAVLTDQRAAVVADQVDLDEPWPRSSQSAQVRIGIWNFSSDPGLVWERPRS